VCGNGSTHISSPNHPPHPNAAPLPQAFRAQVQGIFGSLRTLHIVLYVCSVVLAAWMAFGLVTPYIKLNMKQMRQVRRGGGV